MISISWNGAAWQDVAGRTYATPTEPAPNVGVNFEAPGGVYGRTIVAEAPLPEWLDPDTDTVCGLRVQLPD